MFTGGAFRMPVGLDERYVATGSRASTCLLRLVGELKQVLQSFLRANASKAGKIVAITDYNQLSMNQSKLD